MKTMNIAIGWLGLFGATVNVLAGESTSTATASSNGRGPGTAAATAGYDGDGIGIARTNTRTGTVNLAQGIGLGFDEDGLSLSTSYAIASLLGPAVGGTFNLAIGLDGSVSSGVGQTVASGDRTRAVEAGGSAAPGSRGRSPTAVATVGGVTGPHGTVTAQTHSQTYRPVYVRPLPVRVTRPLVRESLLGPTPGGVRAPVRVQPLRLPVGRTCGT